jgi:hypothetical protein
VTGLGYDDLGYDALDHGKQTEVSDMATGENGGDAA